MRRGSGQPATIFTGTRSHTGVLAVSTPVSRLMGTVYVLYGSRALLVQRMHEMSMY